MNFRLNQKKTVHRDIKDIRNECEKETVGVCCGKQMNSHYENNLKIFICEECGKFFKTQEMVEMKAKMVEDISKKIIPYGSRSSAFYRARMKEEVRQILLKTMEHYNISEEHVIKIMDHYFAIRDNRIPRANPRKGLILACVYKIAGIPIEYLSKIYGLKQKYITEGLKIYRRSLTPYEDFSLTEMVRNVFYRFTIKGLNMDYAEEIVLEIVSLSINFYIASDTTIKTKVAGALYFLANTGFYNIELKTISESLNIGITTVYKFYDQFVVALMSEYNPAIKHRRLELLDYLKTRKINFSEELKKKRMLKYLR